MPVGRDGDQLVPGAAPEFQYAPALPAGAGPVEADCGPAAREHQVVQPRVRVERLTHEAPPPFRLTLPWPQVQASSPYEAPAPARPGRAAVRRCARPCTSCTPAAVTGSK